MTNVDVAIVGAGISGLSVARGLIAAERSVHIFEARGRSGGRMLSAEVSGGFADLGPTWFWPNEARILSLISEFDIGVHRQFAEGNGLVTVQGETQRVRGFGVAPAFRFSNGAQSLSTALTNDLPDGTISYDAPVTRIERGDKQITVHTADSTMTATAVVLCLPPSLVVSAGIVGTGELEASVVEAAAQVPVWMGAITKAVAVYEHAFWRDRALIIPDSPRSRQNACS